MCWEEKCYQRRESYLDQPCRRGRWVGPTSFCALGVAALRPRRREQVYGNEPPPPPPLLQSSPARPGGEGTRVWARDRGDRQRQRQGRRARAGGAGRSLAAGPGPECAAPQTQVGDLTRAEGTFWGSGPGDPAEPEILAALGRR